MDLGIPTLGTALGMIELYGYTAAMDTADVMAKSAEVRVVQCVKSGQGYMTLFVIGDTSSVYMAIEAGCESAKAKFGGVDMHFVIPYPGTETLLYSYYWDRWKHERFKETGE